MGGPIPDEVTEEVEALFCSVMDMHGEPVVNSSLNDNLLVYWGRKERRPVTSKRDGFKCVSWGTRNYLGVYYVPRPEPEQKALTLEQALAELARVKEHHRQACANCGPAVRLLFEITYGHAWDR